MDRRRFPQLRAHSGPGRRRFRCLPGACTRAVALRLARAMEDGASQDNPTAPNAYEVHLNRDDCGALLRQQPGIARCWPSTSSAWRAKAICGSTAPHVTFVPTRHQPHGVVVVAARPARSAVMTAWDGPRGRGRRQARCRRSLVDGSQYVPLDRSVITSGGVATTSSSSTIRASVANTADPLPVWPIH